MLHVTAPNVTGAAHYVIKAPPLDSPGRWRPPHTTAERSSGLNMEPRHMRLLVMREFLLDWWEVKKCVLYSDDAFFLQQGYMGNCEKQSGTIAYVAYN
ncbi:hypothetical protein ACSQ67_025400 [Phaseolus vulgaris]